MFMAHSSIDYEIYLQELQQTSVVQITLPGYCFLHDLGITASHYVIIQNPVSLRMLPLLLGTLCPAHCISWTGKPPQIHLFSRPAITPTPALSAAVHYGKVRQDLRPSVQLVATSGSTSGALKAQRQDVPLASLALQQARTSHDQQPGSMAPIERHSSSSGEQVSAVGQHVEQEVLALTSQAATVASIPGAVANAICSTTQEASSCAQQTITGQEAAFVFHQANAYESEDGQSVIVDCIRYPSMPDFEQVRKSRAQFAIQHQMCTTRLGLPQ